MLQSDFAKHVAEGLSAQQAYLSSRFIYDERGSKLFQQIMELEEYYLTRAEAEILTVNAVNLVDSFSKYGSVPFELIELGAGDGAKTKLLLKAALQKEVSFSYRPVDISSDILAELSDALAKDMPKLQVDPIAASYDDALQSLSADPTMRRVVLFLGSNIGNFSLDAAQQFVQQIGAALQPDDLFVMGVDLRKSPRKILRAYDDAKGVTSAFNLNLLHRANAELGANFKVDAWGFYPLYNPESGEVRSYLYPLSDQEIKIPALDIHRTFIVGDVIHTEVSRKYSRAELADLARVSGYRVVDEFSDRAGDFVDVVWAKVG